jgi:hypothetical protein
VTACQLEDRKYRLQLDECQRYDEKASEFEEDVRRYDAETVRLEEVLRQRLAEHRERLLRVHAHELQLLMDKWGSDAKRRQYSHASIQLRYLRKQYRRYMIDCQFQDAEALNAIVTRTERAEQAEAAAQLQHDFDESIKKLKEKQVAELAYADDAARVQIAHLRQRRLYGRQKFMNKTRKFEKWAGEISDPEKLWNLHQAERKVELAKGGQSEAATRLSRLTEEDVPQGEDDALIELPPLRVANVV